MLLLAAALFAAATAPVQPVRDMPLINPNAGRPATCPATSRYEAARRGGTPKARKLGELPDADMYRAVYRRIGHCVAPVVVKYGVSR